MARVDVHTLKKNTNIVDEIGKSISLKKKGSFYAGTCPFHHDTRASFEVVPSKQIWACQPCGIGGDVIEFYIQQGKTFKEACEIIAGNAEVPRIDHDHAPTAPKEVKPEWLAIKPPQETPEFHHYLHGEPSRVWTYRDLDGSILGYTCRFDLSDGGKEVLPYFYCSNGTRSEWRWKGPQTPKPLYGLEKLIKKPTATIILVEGEKTADALQSVVDHVIVLSWMGGANGIHKADWRVIFGRKVLIWPDNDWEGMGAAIQIWHYLAPNVPLLKLVQNPPDVPKKWDFADCDWDKDTTRAYVNSNLTTIPEPTTPPTWAEASDAYWLLKNPDGTPARHLFKRGDRFVGNKLTELDIQPEPPQEELPTLPIEPEPPVFDQDSTFDEPPYFGDDFAEEPNHPMNMPFRVLGFERVDLGKLAYVFYDSAKRLLIRKSASELTKSALLELASLNFWEGMFPGSKSAKIDEDTAKNFLIRTATERGLFSTKYVRGRGAWLDNGRVVIHAGDKLIVNGQKLALEQLDTSYIYEVSEPLNLSPDNPMSVAEANTLMSLMTSLSWEREVNAYLLAGWCVVAPVCGALKWRPHIWVTGGAGTGKSWTMSNIVRPILGETALQVQGDTTEAGLRQSIQMDAVPVIFDEAEPHDPEANRRIQSVLSLMRSASTSDSGEIIKGSSSHAAKSFRINSCFAMASISVAVDKKSDRSRVTILSLTNKHKTTLEELNKLRLSVITETYVKRLQARTLNMLPTIIQNSAVFAAAAAEVLGEQRIGDQLGAMLAGAYALHSNDTINYERAKEWIRKHDWTEEKELDASGDESALLQHIYNQMQRVQGSASSYSDRTVTELIEIAAGTFDEDVSSDRAFKHLKRIGIYVDPDSIVIANKHEYLSKILANTPWSKNHNKILMRLPGAKATEPISFSGQAKSRGVRIPVDRAG